MASGEVDAVEERAGFGADLAGGEEERGRCLEGVCGRILDVVALDGQRSCRCGWSRGDEHELEEVVVDIVADLAGEVENALAEGG